MLEFRPTVSQKRYEVYGNMRPSKPLCSVEVLRPVSHYRSFL